MSNLVRKRGASISNEHWSQRQRVKKQRVPQTCEWIFQEPAYKSWKGWDESVSSTLWIHGPPGAGKSFLAQFILDDVTAAEPESVVLGCFCDATSTPSSVLRTLLAQLVAHRYTAQDVRDGAANCLSDAASSQLQTPIDLSYKLYDHLRTIAGQVTRLTIVVDGLDELPDEYLHPNEFNFTTRLADLTNIMTGRVRTLVMSRTNPHITQSLADSTQIQITPDKVRDDVARLARFEVASHPVLLSVEDQVVERLVEQSEGIFLWTSLSAQALAQETSKEGVLQRLDKLPVSLDEVYAGMLERQEGQLTGAEIYMRNTILRWILCTVRPLEILELSNAVSAETGAFIPDLKITAAKVCGSLVRIGNEEIKPIHQSLRDFLLNRSSTVQTGEDGKFSSADANHRIACTLLSYLDNARLADYDAKDDSWKSYPLVEYATLYWVHHVAQSSKDATLCGQIWNFFQTARADTWFDCLLPDLLPRSVLPVPPRPPINARFFYLVMLKSQLANYFPPEEKEVFDAQFCRRLLDTYEGLLDDARDQDDSGMLTLQRLIELGELNTWLPGRDKEAELLIVEAVRRSLEVESSEARGLRFAAHLTLADAVKRDGKYEEAQDILERILEWASSSTVTGPGDEYIMFVYDTIGWVAMRRGQLELSAAYLQKAVDLAAARVGSQSPFSLRSKATLAEVLGKLGRHDEAEALCAELEKQIREHRIHGAPLPRDSVSQLHTLAAIYVQRGKYREARDVYEAVVADRTTAFGPEHRLTLGAEMQLGLTMKKAGDVDDARHILALLLPKQTQVLGVEHQDVKDVTSALQELGP